MKKLYEFTLNKEVDVKETQTEKNEKGEEIQITKNLKKQIPQKFFIKRPNRSLFDEAELFYGVRLSEGIKAGLLTRALLAKRFTNDGGIFSEIDKEEYTRLYLKLFQLQNDFQRLSIKDDKNEIEKSEYESLIKEITEVREKIQDYEFAQASLFDQTAENRARNKTIMFWVLNLCYEQGEDGLSKPIFGEGSFEDKLKEYDRLEETADTFFEKLCQKLVLLISFWYMGRAATQEEFEKLFNLEEKKSGN
jgi:hypothetical protein